MDADTEQIHQFDAEVPGDHLLSWALSIIENAPRCLIGVEPTGEGLHGERLDWIEARERWRAEYQAYASQQRAETTKADPDAPTGMLLSTLPAAPESENERLLIAAQAVAHTTRQPVRVVKRSFTGGTLDIQIGGVQLRADGAK